MKTTKSFERFFVKDYYKFVCILIGYGPAMSVFRKQQKKLFTHSRKKGHVDEYYRQGKRYE